MDHRDRRDHEPQLPAGHLEAVYRGGERGIPGAGERARQPVRCLGPARGAGLPPGAMRAL